MKRGEPFVGAQVWFNKKKTAYYTVIQVGATHFKAIHSKTGVISVWDNYQFLENGESPKYSTTDLIKALKDEITRTGN